MNVCGPVPCEWKVDYAHRVSASWTTPGFFMGLSMVCSDEDGDFQAVWLPLGGFLFLDVFLEGG